MRTELTSLVLVTVVMIGLFLNISLYSSVSVKVSTVVLVTRDDMMITDGPVPFKGTNDTYRDPVFISSVKLVTTLINQIENFKMKN